MPNFKDLLENKILIKVLYCAQLILLFLLFFDTPIRQIKHAKITEFDSGFAHALIIVFLCVVTQRMVILRGLKKTAIFILSIALIINIIIAIASFLPDAGAPVPDITQSEEESIEIVDYCNELDFIESLDEDSLDLEINPINSNTQPNVTEEKSKIFTTINMLKAIFLALLLFIIIKLWQLKKENKAKGQYLLTGLICLLVIIALFLIPSNQDQPNSNLDNTINKSFDVTDNPDCDPLNFPVIKDDSKKVDTLSKYKFIFKYTWLLNFLILAIAAYVLFSYLRRKNLESKEYEDVIEEVIEPLEIEVEEITKQTYEEGVYLIYRQLCDVAKARNGLSRKNSMTSTEYGELLVKLDFPKKDIFEIINAFEALRYGKIQVSTEDIERLNQALKNINMSMKQPNDGDNHA